MQKNKVYFGLLTEVEQEQFKANFKPNFISDSFEDYLKQSSKSFHQFVGLAFIWAETPIEQGLGCFRIW